MNVQESHWSLISHFLTYIYEIIYDRFNDESLKYMSAYNVHTIIKFTSRNKNYLLDITTFRYNMFYCTENFLMALFICY